MCINILRTPHTYTYLVHGMKDDGLVSPRAEQLHTSRVLGGGKPDSGNRGRVVGEGLDRLVGGLARRAGEDVHHTISAARGKKLITYIWVCVCDEEVHCI